MSLKALAALTRRNVVLRIPYMSFLGSCIHQVTCRLSSDEEQPRAPPGEGVESPRWLHLCMACSGCQPLMAGGSLQ